MAKEGMRADDDRALPPDVEFIERPSQESSQTEDNVERFAQTPSLRGLSPLRLGLVIGLASFVVVASLCSWLGYRAYEQRKQDQFSALLVEVGKQGAINLTTIDYDHAESDVQRILDSSTGEFYDDFKSRSDPFIQVLKKAQSKTVGTVTEAGLESVSGQAGEVLVAVNVTSFTKGIPDAKPRYWRMRITLSSDGGGVKVSKVNFVP